jgi:transcriptional regulator of aromatic amino acid metabolism
MITFTDLFFTIDSLIGSSPFLLFVFTIFFALKTYILFKVVTKSFSTGHISYTPTYIACVLISTMVGDSAWIIRSITKCFHLNINPLLYTLIIQIAWVFVIAQYQSFALFIEGLTKQENRLSIRQTASVVLSAIGFLFGLGFAIFNFIHTNRTIENWKFIDQIYFNTIPIYSLFIVMLPSIAVAISKIRNQNIPRILSKQLKILIFGVITPYWIIDLLQIYPFNLSSTSWVTESYTFIGLSNILLNYAVYYCARKMMGLRFLNFQEQVQSPARFNFMDSFKTTLEQLSHVTSVQELHHITQRFFKDSFSIPLTKTHLYIRSLQAKNSSTGRPEAPHSVSSIVETFLGTHEHALSDEIKKNKVLIYDELTFSNFYESNNARKALINFLETINADIFLPIYEKESLVGYIIIDRYARLDTLYSDIEHDEMLVFASYMSNIINLLQNKNLDTLIKQEKLLNEELYRKHQEINQYKESIRSFLRNSKHKAIGIIFYKNRRFIFGNQAAKEMVRININVQDGHPLTKALKQIAHQVEEYKAPQSKFSKDIDGNTIVLSGVPNLESNNIIITISHPEISDIIKQQIDMLKDPSERDYLLYLETTQSGKLINQLIPGSGETLINFKIELLKTAMSKKAILLDIPEEDLKPTIELLHHVSLREQLHELNLEKPSKNFDIAIKLFGINPIFGVSSAERPLLEQLDKIGTLFIKNIHFLDIESQKYLAEFIHYGFYRTFKGEQKEPSSVRIICSTNQNLQHLVQEGSFSQELYNELSRKKLIMPSLMTLPEEELHTLADGFTEQAIKTQTFKNLLTLTSKDKNRLVNQRPTSLQEIKNKVQNILVQKSKQNEIYDETEFNPLCEVSDPELIKAARLGKQVLKDKKIMIMLWNKFKNQNKIATFLGVNRSSVNRRCKEYNLE